MSSQVVNVSMSAYRNEDEINSFAKKNMEVFLFSSKNKEVDDDDIKICIMIFK